MVLLCGRLGELEPCLASLSNQPEVLEHIIVATSNWCEDALRAYWLRIILEAGYLNRCVQYLIAITQSIVGCLSTSSLSNLQITRLYSDKATSSKPHMVEWDESVYEEYLIERVKTRNDQFSISLAIDFSPTLRRIERIRKLLEKEGVLIITAENPGWRMAKPELISSFSANGGSLIKLTECLVSAANSERRRNMLRPVERRNGILGSVSCPEDTRFGGMKGR
ncbi:unnamed protein product [Schistocephalus solidus]|uniref:Uncharacterized protein n=1 Tax=Schistocephalus solidus TaxID=70667 RepID=A0A183TQ08_SCHSO|nr:unnamed protein product [Schistocephalus solidus]